MRVKFSELAFAIILTISATIASFAGSVQAVVNVGNLTISGNWIRATPPAAMAGGGFLVVANKGSSDDTLVGVVFAGANKSEIHEMKINDGVMSMRRLADGIVVPAGGQIELKPGGVHLMLMGLKSQLKDGQIFPVTLIFAKAGEVPVNFPVLDIAKGKQLMMQGN